MKYLRAFVSIILLVCLDQYTKYMVVGHLELHTYHPILGNVFGLYYLQNQGMAWGMFQQKQIFFLIFTVLVLIIAAYIYIRLLKDTFFRPLNVCILFLVSGAIGNMIDRMFNGDFLHGGVIDFLYIKCINFPVFNVADMYVTISIFVIILLIFIKYKDADFEAILSRTSKKNVSRDTQAKADLTDSIDSIDSEEKNNMSRPEHTTITNKGNLSEDKMPINIDEIFLNEEEEDE